MFHSINKDIVIKEGRLGDISPEQYIDYARKKYEENLRNYYETAPEELKEDISLEALLDNKGVIEWEYRVLFEKIQIDLIAILPNLDDAIITRFCDTPEEVKQKKKLAKKCDIAFYKSFDSIELLHFMAEYNAFNNSTEEVKGTLRAISTLNNLHNLLPPRNNDYIPTGIEEVDLFELLMHPNLPLYVSTLNSNRIEKAYIDNKAEITQRSTDNQVEIQQILSVVIKRKKYKYKKHKDEVITKKYDIPVLNCKPQLISYISSCILEEYNNGNNVVYIEAKTLKDLKMYSSTQKATETLFAIAEPLSKLGLTIDDGLEEQGVKGRIGGILSTLYIGNKDVAKKYGRKGKGLFINFSGLTGINYFNFKEYIEVPRSFYELGNREFLLAQLILKELRRNNKVGEQRKINIARIINETGIDVERLKASKNADSIPKDLKRYIDTVKKAFTNEGYNLSIEAPEIEARLNRINNIGKVDDGYLTSSLIVSINDAETRRMITSTKDKDALPEDKKHNNNGRTNKPKLPEIESKSIDNDDDSPFKNLT